MKGDGEGTASGERVCPKCFLGLHNDCDMTVLVNRTDDHEGTWEECACHRRNHYA